MYPRVKKFPPGFVITIDGEVMGALTEWLVVRLRP